MRASMVLSEATVAKLKDVALEFYHIRLVGRDYYNRQDWWDDDIYTDKQGVKYAIHEIRSLLDSKLRQFWTHWESCLIPTRVAIPYTDSEWDLINELERIMSHGFMARGGNI